MNEKIVKLRQLYDLIDYEPFTILISLVCLAWVFYVLFLKEASKERHQNIKNHFRNLFRHTLIFSILFVFFKFLFQTTDQPSSLLRAMPYIAILCFLWGSLVFVKTTRLITLQYLFLGSMKAGVPVLIVNIFSLMMSLAILLWSANYLFGIDLAPLLATSAAFSIILGLALQDTLGNLFAGISLQVDKSFEIDDWLEVTIGTQKVIGQVKEITWRATVLIGWCDEVITIPNRSLANSQIANFQGGDKPILRSQSFRLHLESDVKLAQKKIEETLRTIPQIRQDLPFYIYVSETTDSWLNLKVAYYIDSYGSQYSIGHQVQVMILTALHNENIKTAHTTIHIEPPMSMSNQTME